MVGNVNIITIRPDKMPIAIDNTTGCHSLKTSSHIEQVTPMAISAKYSVLPKNAERFIFFPFVVVQNVLMIDSWLYFVSSFLFQCSAISISSPFLETA
jgi:hypothetical protein